MINGGGDGLRGRRGDSQDGFADKKLLDEPLGFDEFKAVAIACWGTPLIGCALEQLLLLGEQTLVDGLSEDGIDFAIDDIENRSGLSSRANFFANGFMHLIFDNLSE